GESSSRWRREARARRGRGAPGGTNTRTPRGAPGEADTRKGTREGPRL
ncbi:MAG: hypothetical protein AVDCRST_MAG14-1996, partial [uncultured Rubrobacteraceae bacterium]